MQSVDFYLGLGSRYSYLAFTQIARIEQLSVCTFILHPISSIELLALRKSSPFEGAPVSGQYDWSYRRRDAERWAEYYAVPFREPAPLPADHRLMARACHAAAMQGCLKPYCAAMFRAVFGEHRQINAAACVRLAADVDIDHSRFADDMASELVDRRVTLATMTAHRRGAFGVPTFFVGDRMFWGNDRLPLVEHMLRRDRCDCAQGQAASRGSNERSVVSRVEEE